jgi:hypothetical protein
MTTTINADTLFGGAVVTADASGILGLQAAGNTVLTLNPARAVGVGQTPSFGNIGQILTSQGATAAPTWSTLTIPSNTTFLNPVITNYTESSYSQNSGTAVTLDLLYGTIQSLTLTGNCTVTMPAVGTGKSFTLLLRTGTGGFSVTWATVRWPGGTAPTITSGATKLDKFIFVSDGVNWYGSNAGQNYSV